jgi:hypothetical protein
MPASPFSRLKSFLFTPLLMGLMTSTAVAKTETFADIFGSLIFGASIVTDFLHAASMLLGVGFMIYSVVSFRNHRINPKMVPLDRPVLYLFLGIVLIAIPFLGQIMERTTGEAHMQQHHNPRSSSAYHEQDIDAPLDE